MGTRPQVFPIRGDGALMIDTITQLPLCDRYTSLWHEWFHSHPGFAIHSPPHTWGTVDRTKSYNYFTNLEQSLAYEMIQLNLLLAGTILENLLITDLNFPGLAIQTVPVLRLKYPNMKVYGILHAGSWCRGDIFQGDTDKKEQELISIRMCEKVFVATHYHKSIIEQFFGRSFNNIVVLGGFPYYPEPPPLTTKSRDVLVLGRREQVIDLKVDGWDYHLDLIPRAKFLVKLSMYDVVVIPKVEETFGYAVLDAISVGTIPIVPNAYSYPELLPEEFLVEDSFESKVFTVLSNLGQYQDLLRTVDLPKYTGILDKLQVEIQGEIHNDNESCGSIKRWAR